MTQAPRIPAELQTSGDALNIIVNALEAAGVDPVAHSVNARGLTIWIGGHLVNVKFEPKLPGVYILEDGTMYSR